MSTVFDLELKGLVKDYGAGRAVDQIDLEIQKGEFVSLLGPSGCGKSTTLMMIAGFEDPSSGKILVQGRRVDHLSPEQRNIGIVFQSYALFPHMTVWKNVEYGLKMRKVPAEERKQRVDALLRVVHMQDYANRLPGALSGGQQQRVALARALVIEPDLLLLDEPFSALDRSLREELQREVRRLQKKLGITTIFVTHDQEEALLMSDRIAVMRKGRIEQCATPAVLYKQPSTRFVASFIGRGTFIPATRVSKAGTADDYYETAMGGVTVLSRNVLSGTGRPEANIFFRPEDIRTNLPASAGDITASGKIRALYFQGATSLADLDVSGLSEPVLVDVSGIGDAHRLCEGADITFRIPGDAVRAFPHCATPESQS